MWRRRRALTLWIFGLLAVSLCLSCSITLVVRLFNHLPGFGIVNNTRMQLVWGMFTIVLGAFALDYALRISSRLSEPASARLFAASMGLAGLFTVAYIAAHSIASHGSPTAAQAFTQLSYLAIRLGICSVAAGLFLKRKINATAVVCALAILLGSEAMSYAMDYNPAYDLNQRYPVTPGIAFLQAHAGPDWTLFLEGTFAPDMPTIYGIRDLRSYDAMEMQWFREIMVRHFHIYREDSRIDLVPEWPVIKDAERELHLRIGYVALPAKGKLIDDARNTYRGSLKFEGPDLIVFAVPH